MATDTSAPQTKPDERPRSVGSGMIVGLFWAAAMTVLLAMWLGRKYTLPGFYAPILYLLAAAFAGLGVWHCVSRWRQPGDTTQIESQLRIIRSFLIGAGIFFAFSGGYLLYTHGLAAIGEGVGMILFGGLCALGGLPPAALATDRSSRFLTYLQENTKHLGRVLLAVCAGLIVLYYILFFKGWATAALFPELFGLGLIVLLLAGVGTYLITADGPLTPVAARIVFLMLGGFIGLSLFVAVVGRMLAWRDTTIFGGLAAWQGENAWQLWLCAYAGMLALGLMTASLLLARADIRSSPVLRRVLYGFNTVVTALLLVLVLVLCNIVVYAMAPFQFDWTSNRGVYALAESSKGLLNRLGKDVKVYVIMTKSREEFQEMYTFLDNCQAQTPRFTYKHVSPDVDMKELQRLADRFPVIAKSMGRFESVRRRGGLLVIYGDLPVDPNKQATFAFIPATDLFEDDARDKKRGAKAVTHTFKGEAELMKHISSFMTEQKTKVYVLQDNGELGLFLPEGMAKPRFDVMSRSLTDSGATKFRKFLGEANFDLFGLSFDERPAKGGHERMVYAPKDPETKQRQVPKDAGFLIIPGPSRPLANEALAAIEDYLERGGKMIVMFDLVTDAAFKSVLTTGLEELLKKYGVEVTSDFFLTDAGHPFLTFADIPPAHQSDNEVVHAFQRRFFVLLSARVLKAGVPGKYRVEPLLKVDPAFLFPLGGGEAVRPQIIVESKAEVLSRPIEYVEALEKSGQLRALRIVEPALVGLTVTPAEGKGSKAQIYVFGDAEMISDAYALQAPDRVELNFDLIRTCLESSTDRPGFKGPRPRRITNYSADEKTNYASMMVVPGWIMTMCLFALGAGLWLVRRR